MDNMIYSIDVILDGSQRYDSVRIMATSGGEAIRFAKLMTWHSNTAFDYCEFVDRFAFRIVDEYQIPPFGGGFDHIAFSNN